MAETPKSRAAQRRALFVDAYLAHGENATRAYREAGYKAANDNTAAVEGFRLLRNPKVQKAVEARRAQIRAKFGLTTDRVFLEIGRINFFNPKKLVDANGKAVPLHQLDDDTAAALASVETIETTVQGKGKDKVVTTRRVKGRPFNKVSSLEKAIKLLHLYEKPPPPPPETEQEEDMADVAKRLLFIFRKTAVEKERAAAPKQAAVRRKIKITG